MDPDRENNPLTTGLYIHFPFCRSKCPYCAFYSEIYSQHLVSSFLVALPHEVALLPFHPTNIETIYLGGGTPSLIPELELAELLKNIQMNLSSVEEFTIEVNPATITPQKLNTYKALGINRISLGVQSLDDEELKFLGRIHSPSDAMKSLELIFKAGFENVSTDLIYGIPSQDERTFKHSLTELLNNFPLTHLSVYLLGYEEGTPLYEHLKAKSVVQMNEEQEEKLYRVAQELISSSELEQYEVSSFARPGYACKHNIGYWRCLSYIGLGPSSHSFWSPVDVRWANIKDVKGYISLVTKEQRPIAFQEKLGKRERMEEFIILGLRLTEGISTDTFRELFKQELLDLIPEHLISNGFLVIDDDRVKIPADRMFISNEIIGEAIREV